ncbi:glycosyl hydrolase-related protein [Lederbergia sp. NSJ-179]|uniref:alpha-mannosidase n=1 Tax=Lederbergia sp. NSJ-179 TaxID=2931402 RepID=UPI001FD539B5|nr:glycoside hydrolase family 38 C-terminal domain-containing protein [Lederbergia sp. NSJ-179]MCJ7842953.1 glycosyl hydrolase-related protein [Lederbergia sp. NSJ-179]
MPYETIQMEKLHQMKDFIEEKIYMKIQALDVEAWVTKEPMPFSHRTKGTHLKLSAGDKWGELWDCAWFHFSGKVPKQGRGKKVVLLMDVNGELCIFDHDGVPIQGLTNINSEFDYSLGKPGKRVYEISDQATGMESIDLWADAGCNDLFGHFRSGTLKEADIAICCETTRQLYYDVDVLLELAAQLEESSVRRAKIIQALYEVSLLLVDWSDQNVNKAREILAVPLQKKNGDTDLIISAIGHAHIDLAWLWPIRETIRKGARTFSTVLRNMEKYPDYIFGASQPQLYQWMKDYYPELYQQIKQRIVEGRWEVQGGMWVEPDSNIPSGESLIRQVLHGKKFFAEEFNKDVKTLWVPDIFGYTASLPQILKQSGIDYVMTQKLSWSEYNDHPHHTFFWEGIDGSKVLTHLPPEDTYNSPAAPRSIKKIEREYYDKHITDHSLMLFGIGDGGGGPGEEHLERLEREKNLLGLSPVIQESSIQFFKKLEASADHYKTWSGELYLEKHQGTLTTQARNKKYNRTIEILLRELEFIATVTMIKGIKEYPSTVLESIWKEIMLYQFHDIIPGSSITRVYDESLARYQEIQEQLVDVIDEYYQALKQCLQLSGLTLFNSLPWDRCEWVMSNGTWKKVTIPSMGYIDINDQDDTSLLDDQTELKAEETLLENDLITITFHHDGTIQSIFDKENGRETIEYNGAANQLAVYHDHGDAWDFPTDYRSTKKMRPLLKNIKSEVNGPTSTVTHLYEYGDSTIQQSVVLTLGSRRIDFKTKVDWKESNKMLRTSFPLKLRSDQVHCDIQFGYLNRPTHRNTKWDFAKDEICAHQWIDMSESNYGVALLNDCKYGHRAEKNVLDINLLRSPNHPDAKADRAIHEFVYSFYPHKDDFIAAEVYKKGYELNTPIHRVEETKNGIEDKNRQASFVQLSGENIMISSVKKAEFDDDMIIRLYETSGSHTETKITFGFAVQEMEETNLLEQSGQLIPLGSPISFKPFEIKTLKVKPKR